MKKFSLSERWQYQFDNYMSKGTIALIGGLGVLSLLIILLAAVIIVVFRIAPEGTQPGSLSLHEAAWEALMRTMDAGTMGADAGWAFRIVMFGVTLGGVFIISSLIGVLTSGVESKMDELRKGRSRVLETNHIVILGWTSQIFSIVSELVLANENQKRPCIVVLAEKDKVEMEDEIRGKVGDLRNMRVVCRTGNPIDLRDLELVNLADSRAIIILSGESDQADNRTIKTILAITNNPNRREEPYHIIGEIKDAKNLEAANLVGKNQAQIILADDLISRITAQTCRQSGLSVIYTELLDFGGDEIYLAQSDALVGKEFGACLNAYDDSNVIGLATQAGQILLNPPMTTLLSSGDRLVVISADDDTIQLSGKKELPIQTQWIVNSSEADVSLPEATLILGWNKRAGTIVRELDQYVAKGSHVQIIAELADTSPIDELASELNHTTIRYQNGDSTSRRLLDQANLYSYDHIIVLSSDQLDVQTADANTLVTLLHLRDIADKSGQPFYIVSEMLDVSNRELAEVTRADDFIVSERLISLMMSQIAENKQLSAVFQDLFDPEGSEIYLKPASQYVALGQEVNFYTVVESARQKNQVAIGYQLRSQANDAKANYGVYVNPHKAQAQRFSEIDKIIVLAEN